MSQQTLYNDLVVNGTLVAGQNSKASGIASIALGQSNTASGDYSNVAGGIFNTANGDYSNVAGGSSNIASGDYSSIAGGSSNIASGDYSSIAGGRRAKIPQAHPGAGVWADGQNRDHTSKGEHSCFLDFASGVYLRLPRFNGFYSQAGNIGELKISGSYLYVCTGTDLWGRVAVTDF